MLCGRMVLHEAPACVVLALLGDTALVGSTASSESKQAHQALKARRFCDACMHRAHAQEHQLSLASKHASRAGAQSSRELSRDLSSASPTAMQTRTVSCPHNATWPRGRPCQDMLSGPKSPGRSYRHTPSVEIIPEGGTRATSGAPSPANTPPPRPQDLLRSLRASATPIAQPHSHTGPAPSNSRCNKSLRLSLPSSMLTTAVLRSLRQAALLGVADDPRVLQHLRQRQALARHLGQQLRAAQGRGFVRLSNELQGVCRSVLRPYCLEGPRNLECTASHAGCHNSKLDFRYEEAALAKQGRMAQPESALLCAL